MIKGTGVDVVEVKRIEECINKFGDRFLNKVFSEAEISYCKRQKSPEVHFAGRWAAKEAFFKALPPECQTVASWKSVQILVSCRGKPVIDVYCRNLKRLIRKTPIKYFHLSISHERSMSVALVMAE